MSALLLTAVSAAVLWVMWRILALSFDLIDQAHERRRRLLAASVTRREDSTPTQEKGQSVLQHSSLSAAHSQEPV